MRYCPNCQRINVGRPPICNYCGRTWYVKLCPRGHENPSNVLYCSTCGSTDLSETAGKKPWWIISPRPVLWVILILIIISIGSNVEIILPELIISFMPIVILLMIYFFIGSLNIWPFKYITGLVKKLAAKLTTAFINIIKWIFVGKKNSRGN